MVVCGLRTVTVVTLIFNNMETLSAKDFQTRYGAVAVDGFKQASKEAATFTDLKNSYAFGQPAPAEPSYATQVGGEFKAGLDQANAASKQPTENIIQGLEKSLSFGAGLARAVSAPLAPITKIFSDIIQKAGEGYASIPLVQKFANSKAGEVTARVAGDVANAGTIAGTIVGVKGGVEKGPTAIADTAKAVVDTTKGAVKSTVEAIPKPDLAGAPSYVQGAVRDVIPTKQDVIEHQVAKALDLTPDDINKFKEKAGVGVGQFLADNNLIKDNRAATQQAVEGFFQTNYKAVRDAISSVKDKYKLAQVPGYYDALKAIQKTVSEVPGLEETAVKVENLMNKPTVTLDDVQATKELLDDFFNLYNRYGDVYQNASKEGTANFRGKLKDFIEKQVAEKTGQDIRSMNRNVTASKELSQMIPKRSAKGLTRMHFTPRDAFLAMGLTYFGSPLLGIAAVFVMKMLNSPTIRLRFARYVDSLNDAQKLRLSQQLSEGKVPSEVLKAVAIPESALTQGQQTVQ